MRVATFNLWHGLSPSSVVAFEALEPKGRRDLREKQQVDVLRALDADCMCFQEVNPVQTRAPAMADALRCEFQFQPDLTGIKILGYGPPFNLASGLLELSKSPLRFVRSLQLSGPRGSFATRFLSWQLKESRYALMSETVLDGFGRTLLVNTHLHHGLESDDALLADMEKVCDEMKLSDEVRLELGRRLKAGNLRREQEVELLLSAIEDVELRYELVIVCGDFNTIPNSGVHQRMVDAGFSDAWMELHPDDPGYSFDGQLNSANHILQDRFPSTVVLEDLTFSIDAKAALSELARRQEARRRRIDYIWFRSKGGRRVRVERAQLFGQPNAEGLAPSDHFGVFADLV